MVVEVVRALQVDPVREPEPSFVAQWKSGHKLQVTRSIRVKAIFLFFLQHDVLINLQLTLN